MAFRILSEEQLLLLTDKQQKQYEKELDIYKKRVAFVEQLEKFENADFKPYTPKLSKISVADKIEIKEFHRQEYKAHLHETIRKPDLHVKPVEINKPSIAELPGVIVQPVKVAPVRIENKQPILPIVSKPVATDIHIRIARAIKPDLPVHAKPKLTLTSFKQPNKSPIDLPVVGKPKLTVASFKQPNKSPIDLPVVGKPIVRSILSTQGYKLIARKTPKDLPNITSPNIAVPTFIEQKKEISGLPEVVLAVPAIKPFNKPEHNTAELPAFPKLEIALKPIRIERASMRQLPQTGSAIVSVKPFARPEIPMSSLPIVASPNVAAASFQPPKIDKVTLPSMVIKPPVPKEIRPIQLEVNTVTAPQVPVIAVKPFTKLENKYAGVPKFDKTIIPDTREALEKFLSASNDKTELMAGQNV